MKRQHYRLYTVSRCKQFLSRNKEEKRLDEIDLKTNWKYTYICCRKLVLKTRMKEIGWEIPSNHYDWEKRKEQQTNSFLGPLKLIHLYRASTKNICATGKIARAVSTVISNMISPRWFYKSLEHFQLKRKSFWFLPHVGSFFWVVWISRYSSMSEWFLRENLNTK